MDTNLCRNIGPNGMFRDTLFNPMVVLPHAKTACTALTRPPRVVLTWLKMCKPENPF